MSMTGNMELAVNNPFRYRGYYYDVESGFYYLNSRYYDPQTGRFINAEPNVDYGKFDEGAGLNGYNVFAYCANNPVMFKDDSGEFVISISIGIGSLLTWATYGIATAVGVGTGVVIGNAISNEISKSQSIDIAQSKPTTSNKRPPIAKRYRYKSKKDAREAAKKAGGGREPIHHPNGKNGPHYHPDVPFRRNLTPNMPTPHDHYYYPKGK